MLNKARHLYEFGPFRMDPDHRQLRRENQPVPLQPKAFDILLMLVENSGKVVSKDDLMKTVWPDTFVEESNLSQHIFMLRKTLGDTIEDKRYIVTVPGRGYRLAETVRVVDEEDLVAAEDTLEVQSYTRSQVVIREGALPDRALPQLEGRRRIRPAVFVLAFTLAIAVVVSLLVLFRPFVPPPRLVRIRQLTHLGSVVYNSIPVTDGPRVYFRAWEGSNRVFRYVSPEGGEIFPVQPALPNIDIYDISPNGAEFVAGDLTGAVGSSDPYTHPLWRVPVSQGSPRLLGGLRGREARWSPDGSTIAYALISDLYLADSDGTNSRKLATVPGEPYSPQWSPDGRRIRLSVADARGLGMTLWEADLDQKTVRPLLRDWPSASRPRAGRWTPDGRYFFFTAIGEGTRDIWAMREPKATLRRVDPRPVRITAGPLNFYHPTPSRDGKSVFAIGQQVRGELVRNDRASRQYRAYAQGISADHVAFSRDGQWMAYVAYPQQVLVRARLDGSERRQLTFPPLRVFHPQWSPDGTQLAFQAWPDVIAPKIYLVSSNGGTPVLATPERHDRQLYPSWSSTGDSILFSGSEEDGANPALYRVDLKTKEVSLLPGTAGLYWGQISPDGRHVVALTESTQKLILYDTGSHDARTLVGLADYPIWSADGKYVYYSTLFWGGHDAGIYRWQLSTGRLEKVLEAPEFGLGGIWGVWFGLTPDGDPLVVRNMGSVDLYALDVDLP